MAEVFWSYWDASARFSALAALLLLAAPLLKRWIAPKLLYWAWALLLLRLALPFSLPYAGSIFNAHESLQPSSWAESLRQGVVGAGWGETVLPHFRDQDEKVKARMAGPSWEDLLVGLWLAGIVVMAGYFACNAIRLRRFFRRAERPTSGPLHELFKDTRRRYGIHANVPLLVSREILTPGIAGIFRPRVVLPEGCARELSPAELRCVFLHELTHLRRGDMFVHHILLALCYAHWYNPIAWLALRQFRCAMEKACDAEVVGSRSLASPRQYGLALLQVLQRSRGACPSPAGALCLLGNGKNGALSERIRLIAAPARSRPILGTLGLGLFALSAAYAMTGEASPSAEAERLLRLTSFGPPPLSVPDAGGRANSSPSAEAAPFGDFRTEAMAMPKRWTNTLDVAEFAGESVRMEILARLGGSVDKLELWSSASDASGRTLAYASAAASSAASAGGWIVRGIVLDVPEGTADLSYGLSVEGLGHAQLVDFSIRRVGEAAAAPRLEGVE